MYLTAGHDLDLNNWTLSTKITKCGEEYMNISGKKMKLKSKDIILEDKFGVMSSVLFRPDRSTMITEKTRNYLFFAYFPYGEEDRKIKNHFEGILNYIGIFDNNFERSYIGIYSLKD